MESYFYKCPLCSFVHVVPAYWVSFSPEEKMEMLHFNLQTKEECPNAMLKLLKEE